MNPLSSPLLIRDVGEQGLLARLRRFCPPGMVGDDAALLSVAPGLLLVVTEDVLVDGVHFSVGLASPGVVTTAAADVGWRAAAANLSDLAAMGANPLGITVGLGLPGELPVAWVEGFYEGLTACLGQYGTVVAGGDICRSPVLTVAIAAFGQVSPDRVIRRSTAQPGDAILVTGIHGASRAGLELLLHPEQGNELTDSDRTILIRAHQRPIPRLDVIAALWATQESSQPTDQSLQAPDMLSQLPNRQSPTFRIAGMDSSDGLADAVLQICRASGVGATLDRQQIPIFPALAGWISTSQAMEWALYGGEDFELVLCLPPKLAQQVQSRLPGAAIVGAITHGAEVVLVDGTGTSGKTVLTLEQGFQHFS